MTAADLIALSVRESRIVTECPDADDAPLLLADLGVEADDDCAGDYTDGRYEFWGVDEDGTEWRVHVVAPEVRS